jgi:hypothetical protein
MTNLIRTIYDKIRRKPLLVIPVVMPSLFELSDEDLYLYLESGQVYLQHYCNSNMPEYFKDIKWYWNKDTPFAKNGKAELRLSAKKTYDSPQKWISYCGGRNSGIWSLNWV